MRNALCVLALATATMATAHPAPEQPPPLAVEAQRDYYVALAKLAIAQLAVREAQDRLTVQQSVMGDTLQKLRDACGKFELAVEQDKYPYCKTKEPPTKTEGVTK